MVPKTVFSHKTGETITVECEKCYDEEGSHACIRTAHQQQFANKGNFMTTYAVTTSINVEGLDEYKRHAVATATYPHLGENLVYPALGLAGEAGEVAEKVKKLWRNDGAMSAVGLAPEVRNSIIKEMGDVLWYIAALCNELDCSMSHVASINLEKLQDRRARNVIKSEGDER